MMMTEDMELVREYARHQSEEAFATLVSRHVNLVYSVALRRLGDASLAEEVTQAAFIILARKAGSLGSRTILSAWLCRTAQYTAANAIRAEGRRHGREQKVYVQSLLNPPEPETPTWREIAPLLDLAMAELGEKDHSAIVLRFFEGKDLKQVGAALGVNENAAKTRVSRAVEKLRQFFVRRGVILPAAVLTASISANSVQAAPAALAKTATAVALAKGAAASASTLTLIKGALQLMAWTNAKTAIVITVGVLLAAGTATVVVTKVESPRLDAYLQDPQLNDISNAPPMVAIQPTHFTKFDPKRPRPAGTLLGKTDGVREIGRSISCQRPSSKPTVFPRLPA